MNIEVCVPKEGVIVSSQGWFMKFVFPTDKPCCCCGREFKYLTIEHRIIVSNEPTIFAGTKGVPIFINKSHPKAVNLQEFIRLNTYELNKDNLLKLLIKEGGGA